jgi:tripartite-type tricarboxylate transporter receptor subunit TctC
MKRKLVVFLLALALIGSIGAQANVKNFPNRPVEAVVAWAAGGGADLIFRSLATIFPKYANGQPLVVKNVGAAAGVPGIVEFKNNGRPDGYTILHWNTAHIIKTHMNAVPFTATELTPVMKLVEDYSHVLVKADSPFKDLKDFVAYAKANPGKINLGNAGIGGGAHFSALFFEDFAGINVTHVPFTGGGPAVIGVLNGQVDASMSIASEGITNVLDGSLRMLGVFGPARPSQLPNVQTATEQGFELVLGHWRGIMAPKGTPPEIVLALHDIFKKCIEDPDFQKRMKEMNTNISYLNSKDFEALNRKADLDYMRIIKEKKLGDKYK